MKHLIEFPLEDGETIIVEVEEPEEYGIERARRGIIEKAEITYKEALGKMKPTVNAAIDKLQGLKLAPDEIQLEFGFKLSAKAGVVLASADAEANFKVSLKWTNKDK